MQETRNHRQLRKKESRNILLASPTLLFMLVRLLRCVQGPANSGICSSVEKPEVPGQLLPGSWWPSRSLGPRVCRLQILERLNKMCSSGVWKKQQRLLKNMGAHKVMLDLLQVSYDQVRPAWKVPLVDLKSTMCSDPTTSVGGA